MLCDHNDVILQLALGEAVSVLCIASHSMYLKQQDMISLIAPVTLPLAAGRLLLLDPDFQHIAAR